MTLEEIYIDDLERSQNQDDRNTAWYKYQWALGNRTKTLASIFKRLCVKAFERFQEMQRTGDIKGYVIAREENSNMMEQTMFDAEILDSLPTDSERRDLFIKSYKLERSQTDWLTNCTVSAELARNYFTILLMRHTSLDPRFIDDMNKDFIKIEEMRECLPSRRADILEDIPITLADETVYDEDRAKQRRLAIQDRRIATASAMGFTGPDRRIGTRRHGH